MPMAFLVQISCCANMARRSGGGGGSGGVGIKIYVCIKNRYMSEMSRMIGHYFACV